MEQGGDDGGIEHSLEEKVDLTETVDALQAASALIKAAAGEVVAREVVGDRWIRYTVREETGKEHCVGARLTPLVSRADFAALKAFRADQAC